MALAAYNQGSSHLEDARILAQRLNLNPDSWLDLKKTLPLLSRSKYFSTVKHGFARGGEAVILTESVRTYYEILQKYERPHAWGLLTHEDRSPSKTESPIATILNFISPGPAPEPEP
jgi:membrane-bound lytic murein transglycosylase F